MFLDQLVRKKTADRAELNLLTRAAEEPPQGKNIDSSEAHMVGFTQISPNLGRKSVFLVHCAPPPPTPMQSSAKDNINPEESFHHRPARHYVSQCCGDEQRGEQRGPRVGLPSQDLIGCPHQTTAVLNCGVNKCI